jgi:hypothetical protein
MADTDAERLTGQERLTLTGELQRILLGVAERNPRFAAEEVHITEASIRETNEDHEITEYGLETTRSYDKDTDEPLYTFEVRQTILRMVGELPAYAREEIERERQEQENLRLFGQLDFDSDRGIILGGGSVAVDDGVREGDIIEFLSTITFTIDMPERTLHYVHTHTFLRDGHHLVSVEMCDEVIGWHDDMLEPTDAPEALRALGAEALGATETTPEVLDAFRRRQDASRAQFMGRFEELTELLGLSGLV